MDVYFVNAKVTLLVTYRVHADSDQEAKDKTEAYLRRSDQYHIACTIVGAIDEVDDLVAAKVG